MYKPLLHFALRLRLQKGGGGAYLRDTTVYVVIQLATFTTEDRTSCTIHLAGNTSIYYSRALSQASPIFSLQHGSGRVAKNEWEKPGNAYHMYDVRWTRGGRELSGLLHAHILAVRHRPSMFTLCLPNVIHVISVHRPFLFLPLFRFCVLY